MAEGSDARRAGVAVRAPVARSSIGPADPVEAVDGWEVSRRRSEAPLRLADRTPLTKVHVRADPGTLAAEVLAVPFGRAERRDDGSLLVGSGPGEWLLLAPPGSADLLIVGVPRARAGSAEGGLVSIVDVTHGRALVRLTGEHADRVLAKLCAVDLREAAAPDGTAFRSSVAKIAVDVVRDDVDGERSYLLHCERSSGQYLFDALMDAGAEFGIDVDGFSSR